METRITQAIDYCNICFIKQIWGFSYYGGIQGLQFWEFWVNDDERPIHQIEADAITKSMKSLGATVCNHSLDIVTDYKSVIAVR